MPRSLPPLFAALCLSALPAFGQGEPPTAAERFERRVLSVAAREEPDGRVEAVAKELEALGLSPQRRTFAGPDRTGTNLVAEVPAAPGAAPPKTLMLGAHLDRVEAGRGAVDNAGGCAAVLELVGRFQARPLTNHRVVGLWFDQEELGLLGSRAFVEDATDGEGDLGRTSSLPDAFINFDVFAYGNTLWVFGPDPADAPLAAAFENVTTGDGGDPFPAVVSQKYPPSDHLSFHAARGKGDGAGMKVVSLSLLPREQIAETVAFLGGAAGGGRPTRAGLPAILRLIHTAADGPDAVRPAEAAAGIDAVEAALRAYDAAAGDPADPAG